MKMQGAVRVWNVPGRWGTTIGVNWSAVGPVTPATARRFARLVIKAADQADRKIAKAKANGFELENPEQ